MTGKNLERIGSLERWQIYGRRRVIDGQTRSGQQVEVWETLAHVPTVHECLLPEQ